MNPSPEPGQVDQNPTDDREAPDGLTPEESSFVDALSCGASIPDAAKLVGLSPRSGRRWKAKAHVASALRARLSENVGLAKAVLAAGAARAATALVEIAGGQKADPVQVSACRSVLENAIKAIEISDLQAEVAKILEQQEQQKKGGYRQ